MRNTHFSSRGRGFTLVELMAVILIISFLAALLLPALNSAIDSARRVLCMSDRRENYIQITHYVDDHDGMLMGGDHAHSASNWLRGGSYPGGGGRPTPIGTLVKKGYVEEPGQVFCPDYVKPQPDWRVGLRIYKYYYDDPAFVKNCYETYYVPWIGQMTESKFFNPWDVDEKVDYWHSYIPRNGLENNTPAGLANYLFAWTHPNRQTHISGDEMQLSKWPDYVARRDEDLSKFGSCSPMLISCADNGAMFKDRYHHVYNAKHGHSHDRTGLTGAFYDGSVRWIGLQERGGNPNNLNLWSNGATNQNGGSKMQKWAKKKLTLLGPE